MATYTHIQLPYFAPPHTLPAPLPSHEEITAIVSGRSEGKQLEVNDDDRGVVKIGEHFVVKYGKELNLIEGENMLFVREHTNIPVPTVYAMFKHEPSKFNIIIMEFISGKPLHTCIGNLSATQRQLVGFQLRSHVAELRKIPSAGFFGVVDRRPYINMSWVFKREAGPFESAVDFIDAYFSAQFGDKTGKLNSELDDIKSEFLQISKGLDSPVFTHADLQTKNIILREDNSICIIDYESAGFYAEYFEYFTYGTYDLMLLGSAEGHHDSVMKYSETTKLVIKAWSAFLTAITDRPLEY
ncbi:kinase-like domain-containing protein [Xylariaceae sp. FL0662B]|nr:kinase-like domain-containing protein [Xylariaceae sp. FL0662B]